MNILFIGDMVAPQSIDVVRRLLRKLQREQNIDLVIANGENIHTHNGLNKRQYEELLNAGIDVVTLGNHCWDQPQIYHFIDEVDRLVRPFNYPPGTPGVGWRVLDAAHRQVAVVAALGNVALSTLTSPFQQIKDVIKKLHEDGIRHIIVDIHAEATSEKIALGYFLDGQVSAVLGTHTHVPTADARILPQGTAYQTDVGMTGPYESVIGMTIDASVARFVTQRRVRYEQESEGPFIFCATLITLDDNGHAVAITPIQEFDELKEDMS